MESGPQQSRHNGIEEYPGDLRKQSGFKKQMKEFKHSSFTFFFGWLKDTI